MMQALYENPIVQGVLGNAFYGIILFACYSIRGYLSSALRWKTISPSLLVLLAAVLASVPMVTASFISSWVSIWFAWLAYLVLAALCWKITLQFSNAGIYAAFDKTANGINFEQSLQLVKSRLDFLGVGADKLTKTAEFEEALIRASRGGQPVRLLLSPPNNPLLAKAASRARLDPKLYSERVRDSLRRLAKLSKKGGYNVQVRFYKADTDRDYQQFRLMFIDEKMCLVSHTVWDRSDGSDNPQVLLTAGAGERNRKLYGGFSEYFDRIWNDPTTTQVDLDKYDR